MFLKFTPRYSNITNNNNFYDFENDSNFDNNSDIDWEPSCDNLNFSFSNNDKSNTDISYDDKSNTDISYDDLSEKEQFNSKIFENAD